MRAVAFAVCLITASGVPALAQQQAPEAPTAWRVECSGDGKTLECRAVHQVTSRDGRVLIAQVSVHQAPDAKQPAMMIQLPLNLNLTEPVAIRVDAGTPERQPLQTCSASGCYAGLALSDQFLAAMRSGHALKIVFQDANRKTIEAGLPLLGFGLAFDKAK
jgi:invasion protein IalB